MFYITGYSYSKNGPSNNACLVSNNFNILLRSWLDFEGKMQTLLSSNFLKTSFQFLFISNRYIFLTKLETLIILPPPDPCPNWRRKNSILGCTKYSDTHLKFYLKKQLRWLTSGNSSIAVRVFVHCCISLYFWQFSDNC